jgi:glycosyltransferase involved in cell wall biosynthesis
MTTTTGHRPRFSIITPIYETPPAILDALLATVQNQTFTDWELCLADDGSKAPHIREVLARASAEDPRIKVFHREQNGGIVEASNDCLDLATGEFVAFLDHDDELVPHALERMSEIIDTWSDIDYIYSDEDKIDEAGRHSDPFYKPDWSPERFRCQMYTCHFGVHRRSLVEEVGRFRAEYNGSQDFDLVFRVTEKARRIHHIPEVLYHWRIIAGSAAGDAQAKPYAWLAGAEAIQSHCDRTGFEAEVEHTLEHPGWYHLRPRLTDTPLVSIIIPTNGTRRDVYGKDAVLIEHAIESIAATSTYEKYELIVVLDDDAEDDVAERIERAGGDRVKIIPYSREFNFAEKINLGACYANGDHLLLLNDDVEVDTPEWIESLLMYSRQDAIGAVGARLLFGDGRLQHVGIVNTQHGPTHVFYGYRNDYVGYFSAARMPANYLAVTAACMMTRRLLFEEIGGLCTDFPSSYNDVDYCFKLIDRGLRVAYNPEATLYHFESSSRSPVINHADYDLLTRRWRSFLERDPYNNPNFLGSSANFVHPVYLPEGALMPVG